MRIKFISPILYLALFLTGCVREDLSDCVGESGARISFRYEQAEATTSTLPIKSVDLYLFDADNRFVCSLTDTEGPFMESRTYDVPLPPGSYTAIAWGNRGNSHLITPTTLTPGSTLLSEAYLKLAGISYTPTRANEYIAVPSPSAPLYHASASRIEVVTAQMTRTTLLLTRNTKDINIEVSFKRPDGTPCNDPEHAYTPVIRSNDGILRFDNSVAACPWFFYQPVAQTPIEGGYNAHFRKMKLAIDETSEIILAKPGATDTNDVFFRGNLMTWIMGTGYPTQEMIDKTHTYKVELHFECKENSTHVTVRIFINGWEYTEVNDGV